MNADSFIVYIKTEDIYVDIVNDVEARLDVTDEELRRPFPKEKN